MKRVYVYRNTTVEYLFRDNKIEYEFSAYGDISMPKQEYDVYLFFYIIPYKFDQESLVSEIDNFYQKIEYLIKQKPIFVVTLCSYFDNRFVYSDTSLENKINEFNERLYKSDVRVIELGDFLRNRSDIIDMKYYYLYNAVINPRYRDDFSSFIYNEITKYDTNRKKCLVLDLDNTLWHGVIGEDGISNVKMSGDYPGNAFCDFQRLILQMKRIGIILCIASKNNKEDVNKLFQTRNDMILKKDDFVIIKASWEQKNVMVSEIAKELNIGLYDIVFIDDDRFQRELVKNELPEVYVPEFPSEAYMLTDYFSKLFKSLFGIYRLTDEDLHKTNQYKARINSEQIRKEFCNIDDFIKSLDMKVSFEEMDNNNITRIEELINKSNQFNLTTRRYSKDMLEKMKEHSLIYAMRVKDKFDHLGIVGIIIANLHKDDAEIDTLLLSCRVIGRKLEFELLNFMLELLKEKGYKIVMAKYIKTLKNSQVKDFYKDAGFNIIEKSESESLYQKEIGGV